MRPKLSELSKAQLKAIDDIQAIMDELKDSPITLTSNITEEEKQKISELILDAAAKSYQAGYNATKGDIK